MQGATSTSVSEKQLQNETETIFVKIVKMMQFKNYFILVLMETGLCVLPKGLNVIKLRANLPKHYS